MVHSQVRQAPTLLLVGVYTAVFIALAVTYMVISHFVRIENSAMGLLIAGSSAAIMARSWVSRERAAPGGMRAWAVCLACALVATVLMASVGVLGVIDDDQLLRDVKREGPMLIAGLAAGLVIVNLLFIRLGLWFGLRQALKVVR